jgi:hypothetical protein
MAGTAGQRGNSLVTVYGAVAPEAEADYNTWYNTHHIPPRMQVPGFLAAVRYRIVGGGNEAPRYLTFYELAETAVLKHPVLQRMTDSPDDWDRRVTAQVKVEGQLIFKRITALGTPGVEHAPVVFTVRLDVDPAMEEEFNRWYDTEHLPALGGVAGVQSARRYALRFPKGGPQYLTVYEFDHDGVRGTDAWRKAAATPWTAKMQPYLKNVRMDQGQRIFEAHSKVDQ